MNPPPENNQRLRRWFEERWPLAAVWRWSSAEEIPGGSKFAYVLGSATLFLFAVLVITGVWQLVYYVPTVDHAYDSVMYLRLEVPLGWLVHGLHYWAAQGFIVVMGLHMARVFIWAAYKRPRELTWVFGVVLLLLGAAFIFTGAILPWDTLGYWAGEVGTSMAGTVPLIGTFLKSLMRGGATMDQMTLSRAFVVHAAILPALTFLLVAAHLVAFRQSGSVGPWNPRKRQKSGWFWPDQTLKDLLVILLILVALVWLCAFVRAPVTGPADPLDNSYAPKPEWNFLFLYEALKAFKGPWERVGTVVIPTLLVLLLFAVPFIDRNEKRNPFHRPVAMLSGFLFVAVILALTFIGHYSKPGTSKVTSGAHADQSTKASLETDPPPDPPAAATAAIPLDDRHSDPGEAPASTAAAVATGRELFLSEGCIKCHTIEGKGGKVGPNLSHEAELGRSRKWLITQIRNPAVHDQTTVMPSHSALSNRQLNDLVDYLLHPSATPTASITGPPAEKVPSFAKGSQLAADYAAWQGRLSPRELVNPVPVNPATLAAGKAVYRGECQPCHGSTGLGNGPASIALLESVADLSASTMWAYSDGRLFDTITRGQNSMPAFRSLLTATQRWEVVNYIRTLSPKPPGLKVQQPAAAPAAAKAPAPAPVVAPAPARPPTAAPVPAPAPAVPSTPKRAATITTPRAAAPAKAQPGAAPTNAMALAIAEGRRLFVLNRCTVCHTIEGKGGKVGPNLSHEAELGRPRQWLITQIRNPAAHDPTTIMPPHPGLSGQQLNDLVDYLLHPSAVASVPAPAAVPAPSKTPAATAVSPSAHLEAGARIFVSAHCIVCHTIEGTGGTLGPDLSHEAQAGRTREWLITQILDPFKHNPTTIMYSHKSLTEQQLDDLTGFLLNPSAGKAALQAALGKHLQRPAATAPPAVPQPPAVGKQGPPGPAVKMVGDPRHGKRLFDLDCRKCHGANGEGGVPNPGSAAGQVPPLAPISRSLFSEDPLVFVENLDRFVQHGATPPGSNPALRMPAFGATRALTQQEIANIEAYLMSLNGVDRAKIIHPGIAPRRFAWGALGLAAFILLVIVGLKAWSSPWGGYPTQKEYEALRHKLENLEHKLGENKTGNPKDSPGTTDSEP